MAMDVEVPAAPHRARADLVAAVVAEVAELGYQQASVAGICERAGVPLTVFAEEFADKEACFLEACQELADALLTQVAAAVESTPDWQDGVRAGLGAFLTYLAEHPSAARACLVEGLAAGPEALAIRDLAMRAFAHFVDIFHTRASEAGGHSTLVSEASVGGIYGIVIRRIRNGQTSTLPELLSSLAYFLLAPVVGCPRARRELSGSTL